MSFPRYPAYKDSGVEWLGEVPAHWIVIPLGRVATARCDGPFGSGLKSDHYTDEGARVIRLQNIRFAEFDGSDAAFIDLEYALSELAGHDVLPGDVLVAGLGDERHVVGRACVAPAGLGPALVKADCFRFRLDQTRTEPNFVAFQLSAGADAEGGRLATGTTRQRIPLSATSARRLALPPVGEQSLIASFLDRETAKIDALIAEQERLIELLKEKRQAVISHAVTKGLDPDVPMKDSGVEWLGEVPAHWEVKPLRYCIDYSEGPGIMASEFRDEGVPLLRVAGVQERWASLDGCNFLDPALVDRRWSHFRLEAGDLLISGSASMGLVCEVGPNAAGAIPYTGLIRLRGIDGVMTRDFIRATVISHAFFSQIDLLKAGATIQHFGPTHLSQMRLACPPVLEQVAITTYVDEVTSQIDDLIVTADSATALLQERRAALISAAVTGQIDVRDAAPTR